MSRVQRLAGPAGRQGPFVPVGGTNRDKRGAFYPGWWLQPGQKLRGPFVPVGDTNRDKRPPFCPGPNNRPGQKRRPASPSQYFSKSLAPLLSFLSISSLYLYLISFLPPPFLSGAAPPFSPHSLRPGPARAGVRRAAAGPWRGWRGRVPGELREARPCAGGGSSAKPRRAARLGPGVGGAARAGERRLSVAPASGAARQAPAAAARRTRLVFRFFFTFFPNMYMDWDSYVLVNDFV